MLCVARQWSFLALAGVMGFLGTLSSSETRADEKEDALKAFSAFEGKWDTGITITKTKSGRLVATNVDGDTEFVIAWDSEAKKLKSVGFFSSDHSEFAFVHGITVLGGGKFRIDSLYGNKADLPFSVTLSADAFEYTNAKGEKVIVNRVK